MIALLDNTVLSNFAVIRRPDLILLALGQEAATTQDVMAEHNMGVELGRIPFSEWSWLPILGLGELVRPLYHQLRIHLGRGEASCIALAHHGGYRVLTDDRDARRIAMQMQVPVSGTLGLLALLLDSKHLHLTAADQLLQRMIEAGYHSPISSLSEIADR